MRRSGPVRVIHVIPTILACPVRPVGSTDRRNTF